MGSIALKIHVDFPNSFLWVDILHCNQIHLEEFVEVGNAHRRPGQVIGCEYLVQMLDLLYIGSVQLHRTLRPVLAVLRKDCAMIDMARNRKFLNCLIIRLKEYGVEGIGLVGAQAFLQFLNRVDTLFRIRRNDRVKEGVGSVIVRPVCQANVDGKIAPHRLQFAKHSPLQGLVFLLGMVVQLHQHILHYILEQFPFAQIGDLQGPLCQILLHIQAGFKYAFRHNSSKKSHIMERLPLDRGPCLY